MEYCRNINIEFLPKEIVVDFEIAIHNAISSIWQSVKITGCRFHLTQSWYRQIQKLGLTNEYKDQNSEIGKWLHYCFGLIFLNQKK